MFCRVNKSVRFAILGAALAAAGAPAMADVLVARSIGPSAADYPRGARLPDNATLALRAGDRITLLTPAGTRILRGPGRVSVSGARQLAGTNLASRNSSRTVARTGVSRGAIARDAGSELQAMTRNVWQVDIGESGPFCFVPEQSVTLWRTESDQPATVTVTRVSDGTSTTVDFAAGQWSHDWPDGLAAAAGSEYLFNWPGHEQPTRITFTPLAADPSDPVGVGDALLANDCGGQLDALVNNTENADAAAEGSEG